MGSCRLIGDWHRWDRVGSNLSSAGLGLGNKLVIRLEERGGGFDSRCVV